MISRSFKVSVITPVYNAASTIRRAVESAMALDEVAELLLIDDAGPDNALDVCRQLQQEHPRVRLIRHPDGKNHGAGASRNLGLKYATSSFIAFLDADDYYLPNRFMAEREILPSDKFMDGVYGATLTEYEDAVSKERFEAAGFSYQHFVSISQEVPPEELFSVLFWQHPIIRGSFHTDAITIRAQLVERVGGFNEALRLQQDTHLWCRFAAIGRLRSGIIDRPVAVRCIHGRNRMTDTIQQSKYIEYWWMSLQSEFRRLGISHEQWVVFRRAYARHLIKSGQGRLAGLALARTVLDSPSSILQGYGFFDINVLDLSKRAPLLVRLLSLKNRIANALGIRR